MNAPQATSSAASERFLKTLGASALTGALYLDCVLLVLPLAFTSPSQYLAPGMWIGILYYGNMFGGLAGVILGPLLRYTLLRRVPASRAIAWSLIGTTAGIAVGAAYGWYWLNGAAGLGAIEGAAIALLFSSLVLWWRHRPSNPGAVRQQD
jgi:hypothetical protein